MRRPPRSGPPAPAGEGGQATVELALALPVVVLALLLVIQVALVARDQILVVDAAREGARAGAVRPGAEDAAARDTPGLRPERIEVSSSGGGHGGTLRVLVRYRSPTEVPIVGALLGDPTVTATVTMLVEEEGADP